MQHMTHGNQWSKICKKLKGRTPNSIKNRWNSSLSKRVNEFKHLEEKMKNLKNQEKEKEQIQVENQHNNLDMIDNNFFDMENFLLDNNHNNECAFKINIEYE
jgi:hypothetical protein